MNITEAQQLIAERADLQKAFNDYAVSVPNDDHPEPQKHTLGVFLIDTESASGVYRGNEVRKDMARLGIGLRETIRRLVCEHFEKRITEIEGRLGSEAGLRK